MLWLVLYDKGMPLNLTYKKKTFVITYNYRYMTILIY